MKNFLQPGATIDVVAPSGGLTGGQFYVLGSLFGVAAATVLVGETVALHREGVYDLPKETGTAWSQGDALYWDVSNARFTKTAAGNKKVAVAAAAAASGDATGQVSLDQVPVGGDLINPLVGVGAGYKVARGVTAITGTGTVVTGLTTVVAIVATMQDDASLTNGLAVTASVGNQSGAPAAGSVVLKVWKPTGAADTTPIASAAPVNVNWIAVGV